MDIDQLIRDDEVHRDVYVSEEVFALEMDRIFGSAGIYVGHDSQIPEPGDYWTTRVGLESVVMARGKQDEINVFYNRCPHKGGTDCWGRLRSYQRAFQVSVSCVDLQSRRDLEGGAVS